MSRGLAPGSPLERDSSSNVLGPVRSTSPSEWTIDSYIPRARFKNFVSSDGEFFFKNTVGIES